MKIPVYRIQNVLDAFGKQVARSVEAGNPGLHPCAEPGSPMPQPQAPLRQTILDQVENEIIQRVYDLPGSAPTKSLSLFKTREDPSGSQTKDSQILRYYRIDSRGKKELLEMDLAQFH